MSLLFVSQKAEEDIIDIWYYIAVENKSSLNADRFMDKIEKQLLFLADNPGIGTLKNQYRQGLYQFVFESYLIFYFTLDAGGIEVLRILHGARDLRKQF